MFYIFFTFTDNQARDHTNQLIFSKHLISFAHSRSPNMFFLVFFLSGIFKRIGASYCVNILKDAPQ